MVESILTPSHPDPFEALLDEPFACALHHSRAQWQAQFLVPRIVDVLTMPFQIGIQGSIQNTCQNRSQATLGLNGTRMLNKVLKCA